MWLTFSCVHNDKFYLNIDLHKFRIRTISLMLSKLLGLNVESCLPVVGANVVKDWVWKKKKKG